MTTPKIFKMKRIVFIFLLAIVLTGCEDFLDKRDPTATTFVEFFNTEDDLQTMTYSAYYDVFTNHSNRRELFYQLDARSDNAYSRWSGDHHYGIANGNLNSNFRGAEYYYNLYMKHVGRINVYLDNIDVPYVESEVTRTRYENILKGLRVWHYFRLTNLWGDVPFRLSTSSIDQATQPAMPKEDILDIIFPMAIEIANDLPPYEYTVDKYFFNRYSLKAITMRYALYNERYELAADLAEEIMNDGPFKLHPVYADLFNYNASSNNDEFIVHLNRESHSGNDSYSYQFLAPHYLTGNGQSYVVPLKSLVDSYWTLQGDPIDASSMHTKQEYELNPKLNRDPRYAASIMGHGDLFIGKPIDVYTSTSTMYWNTERGSKSGYWFKKFVDPQDQSRSRGTMEYGILRYAEVLLTYAEAKIELNQIDASVKKAINDIRRRAGLDMTKADVTLPKYASYSQNQWRELIRNERRIELAGEGVRYDDIRRWRIAEDVLNQPAMGHMRINPNSGEIETLKIEDRSFSPHQYIWPFHEQTLKVNPNLKQNPGY